MTPLSSITWAWRTCLTQAVAALRDDLANDLTSGVKSLRANEQRKRAEDALQTARSELARASQLTMMASDCGFNRP